MIDNGSNPSIRNVTIKALHPFQDFLVYGTQGSLGVISTMNGQKPVVYKNAINDGNFDVAAIDSLTFSITVQSYARLSILSNVKFSIK